MRSQLSKRYFITGLLIWVPLVITGWVLSLIVVARHGRNIPIPFGPYLAAAGAIALFWGPAITQAYLGTIG